MRYLLDTNTVSHLLRRQPGVGERMRSIPVQRLAVSVVTEAELLFGLAKRPQATQLAKTVRELLSSIAVLPWEREAAARYAGMRAHMESQGRSLGSLDAMIAAHALAVGATLVSSDQAFRQVDGLRLEDWTR